MFDNDAVKLTRKFILSKVSEEEIFFHYMGIYPKLRTPFSNPFRQDVHSDCYFYVSNGRLRFHDLAAKYNVDCFGVVQDIYTCSFIQALEHVYEDMIKDTKNRKPNHEIQVSREKKKTEVKFIQRKWNRYDKEFWSSFLITRGILKKFQVYPIENIFMDDRCIYHYSSKDPCYMYWFEEGNMKFYFPYRRKDKIKFMKIGSSDTVQGLNQLPPEADHLVITKSLKDVMALYRFGIYAVAPQGEVQLIKEELIEELKVRFREIYVLFDLDKAGVLGKNMYLNTYNLPGMFFDMGYKQQGVKDFADHCKIFGLEETEKLVYNVRQDPASFSCDTRIPKTL